jgi:hypothetical protein
MKRLIQLLVLTSGLCGGVFLLAGEIRSPGQGVSAKIIAAQPEAFTSAPIPTVNVSPVLPHVVSNPDAGRPSFDEFSWESFIALNWPAKKGPDGKPLRGVADTGKSLDEPGPRVWETWKADYELFQDEGAPPSDWDSYDVTNPPCNFAEDGNTQLNLKVLPMVAKGLSLLPGGVNQAMGGPLIDQNGKAVRYEIHLNRSYYDFVKNNRYYLQQNLPVYPNPPVNFPMSTQNSYGVVEIKAAWREMSVAELNNPSITSRYYITDAVVLDPGTTPAQCRQTKLGLVGLHIAHKSAPFKEWIWSTFEQEDNVPEYIYQKPLPNPTPAPPPGGYSFYNLAKPAPSPNRGGYLPLSAANPIAANQPLPTTPTQVARVNPVPVLTQQMNSQVKALSKIKGTVWEHYKLIETQWPRDTNSPLIVNNPNTAEDNYPLGSGNPTPPSGADPPPPPPEPGDRVANITMETYYQITNNKLKIFGSSCMHCHYQAAQTDFSWVLPDMAWDPNIGARNPSPGVESMKQRKMARSPNLRSMSAGTSQGKRPNRGRRRNQ